MAKKGGTPRQALAHSKFVLDSTSTLMVMCCPDTHSVSTAPPGVTLSTTQVGIRVDSCHGNLPTGLLTIKSFCPEFTTKFHRQSAIRLACACSVTRFKTIPTRKPSVIFSPETCSHSARSRSYASSFEASLQRRRIGASSRVALFSDLTCGSYLSNNSCQARSPSADPSVHHTIQSKT